MESDYQVYKHCIIFNGPNHLEHKLAKHEINCLLKRPGGWMIRNTWGFDNADNGNWFFVIADKYEPENYSKKQKSTFQKQTKHLNIG